MKSFDELLDGCIDGNFVMNFVYENGGFKLKISTSQEDEYMEIESEIPDVILNTGYSYVFNLDTGIKGPGIIIEDKIK